MPPNIICILIDDLGWKDLGCYGSSFYETPHLDQLASEGMVFSDAYASCPVCSPTRASLMTGKYPATVGITAHIGGHNVGQLCDVPYFTRLPDSEYTIAEALRERGGYQTWHVGKWHLGEPSPPEKCGFDINIGGCKWGMPNHGYFSPWKIPNMEDGPDGEYLTDYLNQRAVELVENSGDQPFFLNYWPYAVHTPIQAPEHLVAKYQKKAAGMGLDQLDALEEGEEMPTLKFRGQRIIRRRIQSDPVYAAMVENLDTNIGKLLQAVERCGKSDNTLVVFTSDNGGVSTHDSSPTCNAPLHEGKGWMYEGGTREPLIVRWPTVIPAGSRNSSVMTTPDLYPTFLEAAGIPPIPAQHVDGKSLLPSLRGQAFDRGPVFWHYPHYSNLGGRPGASIREGDWKLIEFFEDGHLELYNLAEDLSESKNLAETNPDRARSLHEKLLAWREQVMALMPARNPHWR